LKHPFSITHSVSLFIVPLAASLLLLSATPAMAEQTIANSDQTLEPVFLANTDGPSEGVEQTPTLDTTQPNPPAYSNTPATGPMLNVATTKVGIPLSQVGNTVTVVTKQEIRHMQANSVTDILRRVPGVDVTQNGGLGQTAGILIRGMNSEHTMVLVDGIEVNDPISNNRAFFFPDQISVDSIDRIEVVRGPQSQLYGSDAIGGVINIITDPGSGSPTAYIRSQAGSYGTLQNDVDVRGGLFDDKLRFTTHAMQQRTAGYSSAGSRYGNHERDGYKNLSWSNRIALQPLPNVSLNFISNFATSRTSLDNFSGYGGDDPNYTLRNKTLFIGGRSRIALLDGKFEQIARFSATNQNRYSMNNLDPDHQNPWDYVHNNYHSQLVKVDVQNNFHINRNNTLTGGAEITNERGRSDFASRTYLYDNNFVPINDANGNPIILGYASNLNQRTATNVGLYLQDHIKITDRWYTTVGGRWDRYNRFGHATTYRIASSYLIPETGTTIRGSYGTGFKAPTLYQLYSNIGNTDLEAEKSRGWDMGVEQKLFSNKLLLGATYYHNYVKNMIDTPTFFQYVNVGNARMVGSEVYTTWSPTRWLTARGSYTATYARDLDQHEQLIRRPRHKMSFNVNIQPTEKFNINLDITHVGNRMDKDFSFFPATRVVLNNYTLVNLALSYKLSKHCTVFGRLMNLLDSNYENVKGYGAPRISAYGGIQLGI
jgi:vitamin B12 transporter